MPLEEIRYWVEEFKAYSKAKESAHKKAMDRAKAKRSK